MKVIKVAFAAMLWAPAATAQTGDLDMQARQAVGLFLQACIENKANIADVRDWMNKHNVPRLKDVALPIFIGTRTGIGYDASNPTGRYALTSEDNGVCSVFAENANDSDVIKSLEASVPNPQQTLKPLGDHNDAKEPKLHHFDYVVMRDGVVFDLVASTDMMPGHIHAMLSFWRRGPDEGPVPATP